MGEDLTRSVLQKQSRRCKTNFMVSRGNGWARTTWETGTDIYTGEKTDNQAGTYCVARGALLNTL